MSNVSGFHDVHVYNGKNKPLADQRLVVLTFKTPSDKKDDPSYKRPEARCVSIPKLSLNVTPQILQDAMQVAFEDLQDALVRKIVVAEIDAGKNVITVHDSQIGFEALAEFAKLEAANGKLNKQLIEDWFDENLGDKLTLALADAMKIGEKPTPEQDKQLAAAVTNYRGIFATLSAPKAGLSPKIATQMKKALVLAENKEDRIYKALDNKLNLHIEQKDPELIGL